MPTFPKYYGPPLPEVLKPLNPRHYLLLLDWIFFKPSRLKQYLYRADPDLYTAKGLKPLWRAMQLAAYRNLVPMALCLSGVLTLAVAWPVSLVQGTSLDWWEMTQGLVSSAVIGIVIGMVYSLMLGVAAGVAFGVTFGVAGGVESGVLLGVVAEGVAGMVWGVVLGIVMGMIFVVTFGAASGAAVGIASGIVLSIAGGLMVDVIAGVGFSILINLGATRSVFYIFQIWPAVWVALKAGTEDRYLSRHPALADEMAVLPFPGFAQLLTRVLQEDFLTGFRISRMLLRNSFQRWVVGHAFTRFFAQTSDPLKKMYEILPLPILDEHAIEPMDGLHFRRLPSVRILWLSEVANVFNYNVGDFTIRFSERLVWVITRPWRGRSDPRIAPLAKFLLTLLDENNLEIEGLAPELLTAAETAVQSLPHSFEVQRSFALMEAGLAVADLPALAAQHAALVDWSDLPEPPLRPQIVQALQGLGDIAGEVGLFLASTSPAAQAGALNRAVGMLNELAHYVEEINLPERSLLRLVVLRWQELVAQAAGRLGEQALRELGPDTRRGPSGVARQATLWVRPALPFPNPYKAGDPVLPPLFVGRQDIFNHIREVWGGKSNPDSIILYGHRRMGKSSILRNLPHYAPAGSLLVYVDLKGQTAFAESTSHLLRGLAEETVWAAQERGLACEEPAAEAYHTPPEAALAFRRLLRRVLVALPPESSLILALDEFEAIDKAVADDKIGPEIYDYLRDLSQQPRVVLVFAGLHTLDEMSRDYRQAFFGSYINLRVSYLSQKAAERLIMRPTPDFPLNYAPEVVQRIIAETHGQPLLLQRLCQELVNQLNHELFDLELEREARILPADLDAVLTDDFIRSETRYFEGIWSDQVAANPAVAALLETLARQGPSHSEKLVAQTDLSPQQVTAALDYLQCRDLVDDREGIWDLRIPLMRRWLQLRGGNSE